jgi:predicted short-subunit dehydrogenase-like oxidoreductase (DUF2520 family)
VEALDDIKEAAALGDIFFLTVPDKEITKVAEALAASGHLRKGALAAHTSGALSSDVLGPLYRAGARLASMHPLQSFADVDLAISKIRRSAFVLEGGSDAVADLREIASRLTKTVLTIRSEDKPLYHAAACVASNYFVTLAWAAVKILQAIDIGEQQALAALQPLVEGTLENVFRLGPVKALTGPIARGDAGTIEHHLTALERISESMPGLPSLYVTMGLHTLVVAFFRGLSLEDADRIKNLLRQAVP